MSSNSTAAAALDVLPDESSSESAPDASSSSSGEEEDQSSSSSDSEESMDADSADDLEISDHEGLCCICTDKIPKYTCPRCSRQTCSLECVKEHKRVKQCTGHPRRSRFLKIKQMSAHTLLNDIAFLSDVSRACESGLKVEAKVLGRRSLPSGAVRQKKHDQILTSPEDHVPALLSSSSSSSTIATALPRQYKLLLKQCRTPEVNVNVLVMPKGMSRNQLNQSRYDEKQDVLTWTVEWIEHSSGKKCTRMTKTKDTSTWQEAYASSNHKSSSSIEFVYLRVHNSPANNVQYYKFPGTETIRASLNGLTVIEFPSVHTSVPVSPFSIVEKPIVVVAPVGEEHGGEPLPQHVLGNKRHASCMEREECISTTTTTTTTTNKKQKKKKKSDVPPSGSPPVLFAAPRNAGPPPQLAVSSNSPYGRFL